MHDGCMRGWSDMTGDMKGDIEGSKRFVEVGFKRVLKII